MKFIIDIEANNLLQPALDYTTMPYKFKPSFKVHCVVIRHVDSGAVRSLHGEELTKENLKHLLRKCTELIGHNIVNYDLPVLMLAGLIDYEIFYPCANPLLADAETLAITGSIFGKPMKITDTLIWSKLLNADRLGGHSLAAWGKRLGNYKGDFNEWEEFSEEMLEYCIQDTAVNKDIHLVLEADKLTHNWNAPYSMEIKLVDLTLKQELFGFHFDTALAEKNIEDLIEKMKVIAAKVDPLLPMKRMTKGDSNKYLLPKIKFKKNGEISAVFEKFLERVSAKVSEDFKTVHFMGKEFPITTSEPLLNETKADIEDIDVVKGYLLSLGWEPTEVKERDITKSADKTVKKLPQIIESIDRYVEQTEKSLFKELRLGLLDTTMDNLKKHLLRMLDEKKPQISYGKMKAQRPMFLPTSPSLTVGLEKEICPNLIALGEQAEFVKEVVHYYTYRHRKNSIAGGAVDEDGEPITGFMSAVREDGRIPTPADTLGANTGRYRHKLVCNVPRVTSLYGENMRNLFGPGKGLWQLGFDFASLEARIMGHYVIPYTDGPALAEALVASKPNDIHSINARKLGIERNAAKSFSYAAIYGAQPKKLAKMLGVSEQESKQLFNDYWNAVPALKELKELIENEWEATGKKFIKGLDGRLLQTRSKHSLINVLFQSGGAIAAKWSTVLLAQKAESLGILGNPFQHTTEEKKLWLMIAYHDECQFAVNPLLLNVKKYTSDLEAKAAQVEGSSSIGHGSKGPYLGFKTQPIECISEGISQSCKGLELRVDLGFEWIPGNSWGQCH